MHEHFMQQAVDVAVANVQSGQGGPYGAVIVRDNQVIAVSGNKVTQHLDPTAHAEIMAIRLACTKLNDFQLTDCILYASCEPCPMCLGAIYWARIPSVYFACSRHDAAAAKFDDHFIYDEFAKAPAERSIAMRQINLTYAKQPFDVWAQQHNKVLY
jgi:guanine deaminase